jgi:hypothetical protein
LHECVWLLSAPLAPGQLDVTATLVAWLPSQKGGGLSGLCPSHPHPSPASERDFGAAPPPPGSLRAAPSSPHAFLMATRFQTVPSTWNRSVARLSETHLEGHRPQGAGFRGLLPLRCAQTPTPQPLGPATQRSRWSPGLGPAGVCSQGAARGHEHDPPAAAPARRSARAPSSGPLRAGSARLLSARRGRTPLRSARRPPRAPPPRAPPPRAPPPRRAAPAAASAAREGASDRHLEGGRGARGTLSGGCAPTGPPPTPRRLPRPRLGPPARRRRRGPEPGRPYLGEVRVSLTSSRRTAGRPAGAWRAGAPAPGHLCARGDRDWARLQNHLGLGGPAVSGPGHPGSASRSPRPAGPGREVVGAVGGTCTFE